MGFGHKPVKNMVHLVEAKGARVFSLVENCRQIDACSFWSNGTPFCLINPAVSNERLRFDLAHELAHLALHRHASKTGRDAEREANRFASEFLMPKESIQEHRPIRMTLPALISTKQIWKVSVSALAIGNCLVALARDRDAPELHCQSDLSSSVGNTRHAFFFQRLRFG